MSKHIKSGTLQWSKKDYYYCSKFCLRWFLNISVWRRIYNLVMTTETFSLFCSKLTKYLTLPYSMKIWHLTCIGLIWKIGILITLSPMVTNAWAILPIKGPPWTGNQLTLFSLSDWTRELVTLGMNGAQVDIKQGRKWKDQSFSQC